MPGSRKRASRNGAIDADTATRAGVGAGVVGGPVGIFLGAAELSWRCPKCGRDVPKWLVNCPSCGEAAPADSA